MNVRVNSTEQNNYTESKTNLKLYFDMKNVRKKIITTYFPWIEITEDICARIGSEISKSLVITG